MAQQFLDVKVQLNHPVRAQLSYRYNSSSSGLMSELARNFVDLQSQLAAAVSRVTVHVPAALSALAGKMSPQLLCSVHQS
jgi:hypothetical protein